MIFSTGIGGDAALHARRNEVIHNGIEHERYSPAARVRWRDTTRAALGFDDADFVLGSCAQLRPEKNHQQLVDAVIALRHGGIPARALIVGEGGQRPFIERYARERAALAHVTLVGQQDEVERYIAAFDVGVLCSVFETFSLAALEQMAMGVPVVLSDQGGAREMVTDGLQGFVFPRRTPTLWCRRFVTCTRWRHGSGWARRRLCRSRPDSGTCKWSIATKGCSSHWSAASASRRQVRCNRARPPEPRDCPRGRRIQRISTGPSAAFKFSNVTARCYRPTVVDRRIRSGSNKCPPARPD